MTNRHRSPAVLAEAERLWKEGLFGSEIAAKLGGGITRDEVAGMARRRGWGVRRPSRQGDAAIVLAALAEHASFAGAVSMPGPDLAKAAGINVRRAERAVAKLLRDGALTVIARPHNRPTVYRIEAGKAVPAKPATTVRWVKNLDHVNLPLVPVSLPRLRCLEDAT
jgi:hypothetical protein